MVTFIIFSYTIIAMVIYDRCRKKINIRFCFSKTSIIEDTFFILLSIPL